MKNNEIDKILRDELHLHEVNSSKPFEIRQYYILLTLLYTILMNSFCGMQEQAKGMRFGHFFVCCLTIRLTSICVWTVQRTQFTLFLLLP